MLLTILLPTYNRINDIIYNLSLLEGFIEANSLQDKVNIIVSNNCSTDDTKYKMENFISNSVIDITLYNQEKNIGLEKNAIFTLEKASSEYVMFLGDDDFLEENYLIEVLNIIELDKDIYCIVPSYVGIDAFRKVIFNVGRDINISTKKYKRGFRSCFLLSYRGHQLSGLTLKRQGLLQEYIENEVHNIYPFIFFVSISVLKGNSYHFTDYPVKVSQPEQSKKDWSYGDDGLINEVFDNYKKLKLNKLKRSLLELQFLWKQPRYMMYWRRSKKEWFRAIYLIIRAKNTSFLSRLFILPMISLQLFLRICKKFIL